MAGEVQGPQHFEPDVRAAEQWRMNGLTSRRERVVVQVPSWLLPDGADRFLAQLADALATGVAAACG